MGAPDTLTAAEMDELAGAKVPAKRELMLVGRDLYRREGDGWVRYPPYPATPM